MNPAAPLGPQTVAVMTDRLIFQHLLEQGTCSRSELSRELKLSKPTASQAMGRLLDAQLVHVVPAPADVPTQRGPSPEYYALNPGYGHLLSVFVHAGSLVLQASDVAGAKLERAAAPLPADISADELEALLETELQQMIRRVGSRCIYATLSVSAPVLRDSDRTLTVPNPVLPAAQADLATVCKRVTGAPLLVDNDVNWMALGEYMAGAGQQASSLLLVYFGPGIGAGLVLDGAVYRGYRGTAAELSYQAYGKSNLIEHLMEVGFTVPGQGRVAVPEVIELFEGEPANQEQAARRAEFLSPVIEVLGNAAGFLDPQRILIGGPVAQVPGFVEQVRTGLSAHRSVGTDEILAAQLGDEAQLFGAVAAARSAAAEVIFQRYRTGASQH
ncbi:ROK family transcriptional regulator [Glutamicibacter sp. PS]|uniref:ROK family transcriptional regulator n=1 Tax=Glutamicibacter sp. PS TaxID=3075634 RepID=UPI00283DA403|nr:ROK family transcriptional regulator [Glutamicibacter sp. PS]MDR4534098.1 ROK family transcriptional regulator [Glutamicibacter sp. PS]